MNAKTAKNIYNNYLPEWAKSLVGGVIRKRLIDNKQFVSQYNELLEADHKDDQWLKQQQLRLLQQTCIHAYEHCAFYKQEFDKAGFDPHIPFTFEEFTQKVPTIDKETVIANMDGINADDIHDDYPATTGGSSGTRLQVNNAWSTFYKENAFIYHFMSRLGYDYHKHRVLLLAGEESEVLCSTNPLYNMIRVSSRYLNPDNMAEAVKFVNKHKPDYITAIPSSAYQFCKYLSQGNYKLERPINGVFFRSENINPAQRKFIEDTLHCECRAYYGSTERIAMGEEVENKNGIPVYQFNKLYGYTEIGGNDHASLISTGFINPKMPLIRYKTDDIIVEVKPERYTVEGHRTAALIGRNGENISVASYAHLPNIFDKVDKYQLEQLKVGELIVNIVPRRKLTENELAYLKQLFEKMSADKLTVTLRLTDHVELTPRGKFKLLLHSVENPS